MRETKVRLYQAGDETGITALFREVFGREMSLDEWRWKYRESYPPKVYSSVAVHDSEGIVGHYGGLCLPFVHKGSAVRCLAICDVMIRPTFRGTRLLRNLAAPVPEEAVRDGIRLGYGFPNNRNLLAPALHLGIYEKVEDVLEGKKDVGSRKGVDRFLFKLGPLDYSDSGIDRLWRDCSRTIVLSVVRNRDYLRWRYQRHPLYSYELWGLRRRPGRELLGLAVLRHHSEDELLIVDYLCPRPMLGVLFRKIENYAVAAGRRLMTLWFPEYLERQMTALGFSIAPSCTSIPRTTYGPTLRKDEVRGKFFYTMGDTDFF